MKCIEGRNQLLAFLFVALTTVPTAFAQTAEPIPTATERVTAMPPKTVDDLWARILTLLAKNQGFVSKQDVEEALGMRFTYTETDDEKKFPRLGAQFIHTLKEDLPEIGHLDVSMFDDPKKISLSLSWVPIGDMRPAFVDLEKAQQDLRVLGWVAGRRNVAPGDGRQPFWRNEDYAESKKPGGKPLESFRGTSQVDLFMPDQISPLVNGLGMDIYSQ